MIFGYALAGQEKKEEKKEKKKRKRKKRKKINKKKKQKETEKVNNFGLKKLGFNYEGNRPPSIVEYSQLLIMGVFSFKVH